ncbi:MAG: hypothetical protein CSA81_04545 [Acidobacteria bacterium]|nr:MAG: hypothetical protein CSA81_04545 [Acidobacteriota bacterium]
MTSIGEKRRQQMIQAVLELVREGGIKNVTTKKIANSVGVSESSIYNVFSSKDEMLFETLKWSYTSLEKRVLQIIEEVEWSVSGIVDSILEIALETANQRYANAEQAVTSELLLAGNVNAIEFLNQFRLRILNLVKNHLGQVERHFGKTIKSHPHAEYELMALFDGHVYMRMSLKDKTKYDNMFRIILENWFRDLTQEQTPC